MGNFTFYAPTRVYFGRKEEEQIGSILKQEGCHGYWCITVDKVL